LFWGCYRRGRGVLGTKVCASKTTHLRQSIRSTAAAVSHPGTNLILKGALNSFIYLDFLKLRLAYQYSQVHTRIILLTTLLLGLAKLVLAACAGCHGTKCLLLIAFFPLSSSLQVCYFSPRRSYRRVQQFCLGLLSHKKIRNLTLALKNFRWCRWGAERRV
jgi:hypothetical protein